MIMNKILSLLFVAILTATLVSCGDDEPNTEIPEGNGTEVPENSKVLVAYFSWGGTTRRMATQIAEQTGGTLFEIVPVTPYPTEYTPCTEVALEECDNNARPAIKDKMNNWDEYDIVFIGCPVWWHTAPMIINTFSESYDFEGKIVVPFCTYASTYRDETLQKIVDLTPDADHLPGLGLTSGGIGNGSNVSTWLRNIKVVSE